MYRPTVNTIVVKIDDRESEWGGGNDPSMLGKSFHKGVIVAIGACIPSHEYAGSYREDLEFIVKDYKPGTEIMWNEGTEAGTTFDGPDGKEKFGLIYWWDIRAIKDDGGK